MRPHPLHGEVPTALGAVHGAPAGADGGSAGTTSLDDRLQFGYDPEADGSYFPDPEDYPPALEDRMDEHLPGAPAPRGAQHENVLVTMSSEPAPAAVSGGRGYLITIIATVLGLAAVVIIAVAVSMAPPAAKPSPTAPAAPAAVDQNEPNPPTDLTDDGLNDQPAPTDAADDPSTAPPAAGDQQLPGNRQANPDDDDEEDEDDDD